MERGGEAPPSTRQSWSPWLSTDDTGGQGPKTSPGEAGAVPLVDPASKKSIYTGSLQTEIHYTVFGQHFFVF